MTTKATKTTKTKSAKPKATKPEQLKIEGTGRLDAIEAVEDAAEALRDARNARMEMGEEESEAEANLTNVLREHKITEYVYEGKDGKKYRAFIPAESKARVQRVKDPKAPKAPKD